jgi:hypothetical protein
MFVGFPSVGFRPGFPRNSTEHDHNPTRSDPNFIVLRRNPGRNPTRIRSKTTESTGRIESPGLTENLSTISKKENEYGYPLDQHEIIDKLLNYMNKYVNICSSASSSTSQLQTTHPIMKSAKEEFSLKCSKELQSSDDETSLDVSFSLFI